MMPEHPTELFEAYALRLLSPATEAEIAAHLSICQPCQAEVAALEATLGALAYAAPAQAPSAQVAERLFARIAALRTEAQPRVANREARSSRDGQTPTDTVAPLRPITHASGRTGTRRWAAALGAAALLVAVVLVAVLLTQHGSTPPLSLTDRAAQALHATDVTTFSLNATKDGPQGAVAAMAMAPAQQRGVLVVAHLPPPPAGKTYEFWLVQSAGADRPATITPSGTFTVSSDGSGEIFFTSSQPIATLMNAGVSLERSGGVQTPDSPMLLLLNE